MNAKSLISNKKHKNHHDGEGKAKGKGKGKGKDESSIRICDLPDSILQLIISFLSTKEAVQTSVLSKRWVYLWRDISRIELTEGAPEKRQQFIDFVKRLLVVCDCSNLEKFYLWCKVGDDASLVNEWLGGFINPKIQELNLDFKGIEEPLALPDHLFTCATLTKFRLSMPHIFKLPSSILFQNLRTLTLAHIKFPNSSSTQQFFSGCPSLEELSLLHCNWVYVKAFCISSPLLQRLLIREREEDGYDKSDEDDDIGGQNFSNCCEVVIIGTNLKSFSYDGDLRNNYFFYSLTSVTNASIEVQVTNDFGCNQDWERDVGYFVFKLLKELPNVEKLSISEIALEAIGNTVYLLGHLPLFCNLAELHVFALVFAVSLSCKALLTIMRNSPCLQVVTFDSEGVSLPEDCANDYILDPLPVCFKKHLKKINIYQFSGSEEELNAIKILLQEASVLDRLCISCFDFDSPMGSKRIKKLYNRIVGFPKGSMDCEIKFEYSCIENGNIVSVMI